jgi:hypothetical protein
MKASITCPRLHGLIFTSSALSLDQQDRKLAVFLSYLNDKKEIKTAKGHEIVPFLPYIHCMLPIFRNNNVRYLM